jgi:hypothetical protein
MRAMAVSSAITLAYIDQNLALHLESLRRWVRQPSVR